MYCTYAPQELAIAAGALPVSLCGTRPEPIAEAEKILPRNLGMSQKLVDSGHAPGSVRGRQQGPGIQDAGTPGAEITTITRQLVN
jgi:hypothetical protein